MLRVPDAHRGARGPHVPRPVVHAQHVVGGAPVGQPHRAAGAAYAAVAEVRDGLDAAEEAREDERSVERDGETERRAQLEQLVVDQREVAAENLPRGRGRLLIARVRAGWGRLAGSGASSVGHKLRPSTGLKPVRSSLGRSGVYESRPPRGA